MTIEEKLEKLAEAGKEVIEELTANEDEAEQCPDAFRASFILACDVARAAGISAEHLAGRFADKQGGREYAEKVAALAAKEIEKVKSGDKAKVIDDLIERLQKEKKNIK